MRLRSFIVPAAVLALVSPRPARAQDPPPRIPWFAVDLHGTVPRFPTTDQQLASSRGLNSLAELPGSGLGVQIGLHVYPVHWRGITFGVGGEVTANRSRQTPVEGSQGLRGTEEKFLSAAPQLSFNFGTGAGWSYISGGIGLSQWSLVPDGQEPLPSDSERLKTINYGGGARWFARPHLAFSFDVRFYAINPGTPSFGFPGSPRTTLLVIGGGVSLK
jgi:outer membrane protein with beta-barrel domain